MKQAIQFLLGENPDPANNQNLEMKLSIDSTSAQAFCTRLGPRRAKHLATRLLWTQQAVRRKWFSMARIATKENPADLNTKALSRERCEFLMKRIGMVSDTFVGEEDVIPKKKQIARMIANLLLTGNLQGCTRMDTTTLRSPTMWNSTWQWRR